MRGPWVAFPFVLVLAACGGGATPSGPAVTATPVPTETPTATPTPAPTPSATMPTATPVPTATPSATAACWPLRGGSGSRAAVADVRVGAQPASDRLVIEFDDAVPAWEMRPNAAGMTFTGGGRGEPETLAGSYGIRLDISDVNWLQDRYPHGRDLVPRYTVLQEVRVVGDFEGIVNLGIGLSRAVCPTVTILASPPRLVFDFPTG